jgi:hypothetical protein
MPRRDLAAVFAVLMLVVTGGSAPPVAARPAGIDAPDTCAGATTTSPQTAWLSDTIGSSADQDWFRFQTSTARYALITLGDLPENYRLDLYSSCSTLVASSTRGGLQYEEIYHSLPAGTYRVRVWSPSGASSSGEPYVLRFRSLADGVFVLSSSSGVEFGDQIRIAGEILNNTSSTREDVPVKVRFFDASDNLLAGGGTTFARVERLSPRKRSMFLWSNETVPAGYDHHTAVVTSAPVSSVAQTGGMAVHPGSVFTDGFGTRHFTGTLQNTNGFAVGIPRVMVTLYDRRGRVLNAEFQDTLPDPQPAHSSNAYEILLSNRYGANRTVYTQHAYFHP